MGYVRMGRRLGVGVRVASGMLRDRAGLSGPQATQRVSQTVRQAAPAQIARGLRAAAGAKRGGRRFGERLWGPFAHAGGVVWLEVTGCFFAFFGLYFAQGAYNLRANWRSGPDHEKMLVCLIAAVVFFYFCVSSFLRARKKERKHRERQG